MISWTSMENDNEQYTVEGDGSYNVYDGTGEHIKRKNSKFRATIRSFHVQYKNALSFAQKKEIAESIYQSVQQNGGNFFNTSGSVNAKKKAIDKIRKSLKDMREIETQTVPARSAAQTLQDVDLFATSNAVDQPAIDVSQVTDFDLEPIPFSIAMAESSGIDELWHESESTLDSITYDVVLQKET
jgi:hypothetical protein